MTTTRNVASILVAVAVLVGGRTAWAQAVFHISSSETTVVRTGHVEPVGGLTFSIEAGTTVDDVLEIDLRPAVLTNVDIDISGFNITGFSASVDPAARRVSLRVPAGKGPGTFVHLEGLRLSVPASDIESLDARISTTKNRLSTGNGSVPVIARVAEAIVIDPSTDSVFTYNSGRVLVDRLGDFTFSEGFEEAFDHPDGGTEIIFQASSLPRNTHLRFPATIRSQSGATLTTSVDEAVTLVSGETQSRVVYRFTPSSSSHTLVDEFSFRPVLERTGSPGAGTGFYQVTMGPTGTRRSRVVPRYEELLLPELVDLPATKTFLFPVERGVDAQSFTVSNTAPGEVLLTIRAFDEDGNLLEKADVDGERSGRLGTQQSLTFDLEAMFGRGATPATVASVAIESKSDRPVATAIGTTPGGAFATHSQTPVDSAYFPFDRRSPGEMPLVSVAGVGAANFASRWTLMDTDGTVQAEAVREAAGGGSVRDPVNTLFGVDANAVPLAGYVHVEAIGTRFRGSLVDNPSAGTHAVPPLLASGSSQMMFPYFVVGEGYNTVVTLINASEHTAIVTTTAFDASGAEIAPGFTTRIAPRTLVKLDWAAILGAGQLRQGYFTLGVEPAVRPTNPFASGPRLAGAVLVEALGSRAAAPLLQAGRDEFFFTPVRSDSEEYTGLVILNAGTDEMEVHIEAYAANGRLLDATGEEEELVIASRAALIGLLRELLPGLDLADGGYVRVASTSTRMWVFALRGRLDQSQLLYLSPQTAP